MWGCFSICVIFLCVNSGLDIEPSLEINIIFVLGGGIIFCTFIRMYTWKEREIL